MAQVQGVEPEGKLALIEFLLTSVDLQESARRALDWLVAHAPVTEAAVLVVEGMTNRMQLVAEHGISSGAIMDFSLNRDDIEHPLIEALNSPEPLYIDNSPVHQRGPLQARAFHAIPLRADTVDAPHGLLLVAGVAPTMDAE